MSLCEVLASMPTLSSVTFSEYESIGFDGIQVLSKSQSIRTLNFHERNLPSQSRSLTQTCIFQPLTLFVKLQSLTIEQPIYASIFMQLLTIHTLQSLHGFIYDTFNLIAYDVVDAICKSNVTDMKLALKHWYDEERTCMRVIESLCAMLYPMTPFRYECGQHGYKSATGRHIVQLLSVPSRHLILVVNSRGRVIPCVNEQVNHNDSDSSESEDKGKVVTLRGFSFSTSNEIHGLLRFISGDMLVTRVEFQDCQLRSHGLQRSDIHLHLLGAMEQQTVPVRVSRNMQYYLQPRLV